MAEFGYLRSGNVKMEKMMEQQQLKKCPIGIQTFEKIIEGNYLYVDKTELKMQDTIYVFEFKVDGTPEEALKQINSKGYSIPYQPDLRKVMKVGVNFDSATRTIGEWRAMED